MALESAETSRQRSLKNLNCWWQNEAIKQEGKNKIQYNFFVMKAKCEFMHIDPESVADKGRIKLLLVLHF